MKLSIEKLRRGMEWWERQKWPRDYHNQDYCKFYRNRANGLTEQWLILTVDHLVQWKAHRSLKPGNTKAKFLALLKAKLPNLQMEYQRILDLSKDEPSINTVSWQDIDALYRMIAEIKDGSMVFASKLCHFIFPKVFIVRDNLATGTKGIAYDSYWQVMVEQWSLFADKSAAIDLLKTEIEKQPPQTSHVDYPYETRIMELCHICDKWK